MIFLYKTIIVFCSLGCIWLLFKEYKNKLFCFFIVLAFSILLGQIAFSIKHPYMCNQDFRYVSILAFIMAIFIGFILKNIKSNIKFLLASIIFSFEIASLLVWWFISV
jgi:hypothetical protein